MSHQKKTTTLYHAGQEKEKAAQGVPLIVVFWALGLGFSSYLVSRFVFTPHPLHWASALGGVLLGVVIGYVWFFKRGDVGLF